ncbi:Protein LIPL-1 [Aphelenchoides avenae]|nr:Protein LIPL-1 [Aphelenchus avenae]
MRALVLLTAWQLALSANLPEENMTTPEIIEYWGYPVEIVEAVTQDGYILTLHRIPYGKKSGPAKDGKPKEVVFMQHGLEASSSNWITNLPNQSAAFIFADAGYDVWLGNMRGNTYSQDHKTLDPQSNEFWRFSFDEMVQYDLDAMINKALDTTGQTSLYYMGHSQGTLTMFSKLARDPNFHTKIRKFFALAPVGHVKYIEGLLSVLAKFLYYEVKLLFQILGPGQFLPNNWFVKLIADEVCASRYITGLCDNIMFLMTGPESNQLNTTRTPVYLSHVPAGTSTQNILHWAQMVRSGQLQMYDFGSKKTNIEHYGQATPPLYDLNNDNAAVHLYWSDADWLADKKDIEGWLLPQLNKKFVVQNIELIDFNHMDFVWGLRAAQEIYHPILNTVDADVKQRAGAGNPKL